MVRARFVCFCAALLAVACTNAERSPAGGASDAVATADPVDVARDDGQRDDGAADAPTDALTPVVDVEVEVDDLDERDEGGGSADAADAPRDVAEDARPGDASSESAPAWAATDRCAEVDAFRPIFDADIARWTALDDVSPPAPGGLVFVGSSSVRRWEAFARTFSDYRPIQRGFGGAQLGEVALRVDDLVLRHDPAVVMVFAGTNDVAFGVPVDVVVERFRCFRQRVGEALGWGRPVVWVAITPTPLRWAGWPAASAVNAAIADLAVDDPGLTVVDPSDAFLATGSPPRDALFVADRLHLSDAGYAIWAESLRAAVEAVAPPPPPPPPPPAMPWPSGTQWLIDLGPTDDVDGEGTPSPDYLGQHWTVWPDVPGGGRVQAGERVSLVTADGSPSQLAVEVTGGWSANGWRNGGLRWPSADAYGALAVGSATGDFFYTGDPDLPGGIRVVGLDPATTYTVRFVAARDDAELRVTRATIRGAGEATVEVQTSGPGAGADGATTNDDDVPGVTGVRPDVGGAIEVDLSVGTGAWAYLSAIELTVE